MHRRIRYRRQLSADSRRLNGKPGVVAGVCSMAKLGHNLALGVVFTYWNGSEHLQNCQLQLLISVAGVFSVSVYICLGFIFWSKHDYVFV